MKKMFSDELETLIQITIADGVLTDQEKSVLVKKATEEGVDINQLDVYIQYLMSQKQAEDNAANIEKIKASKVGAAKKCPHCGGLVPELVDVCPHCKEIIKAEADKELTEMIDKFEDALVELKAGGDIARAKANIERYVRKAKLYYENNPKVQKLLAEIEVETAKAEKKAKSEARTAAVKGAAGSFFRAIGSFMKNHKILTGVLAVILFFVCVEWCTSEDENVTLIGGQRYESYEAKQVEKENKIKETATEVDELLEAGDLKGAIKVLEVLKGYYGFQEDYDPTYLKVFRALVDAKKWDDIEMLALTYITQMDSKYYWSQTSSYTFLQTKYKAAKKDFSMLKYE